MENKIVSAKNALLPYLGTSEIKQLAKATHASALKNTATYILEAREKELRSLHGRLDAIGVRLRAWKRALFDPKKHAWQLLEDLAPDFLTFPIDDANWDHPKAYHIMAVLGYIAWCINKDATLRRFAKKQAYIKFYTRLDSAYAFGMFCACLGMRVRVTQDHIHMGDDTLNAHDLVIHEIQRIAQGMDVASFEGEIIAPVLSLIREIGEIMDDLNEVTEDAKELKRLHHSSPTWPGFMEKHRSISKLLDTYVFTIVE